LHLSRKHLLSSLSLAALVIIQLLIGPASHARTYTEIQTDKGNIALNLTNLGYFGTAFSTPHLSSCEFPQDSNAEHIYRGGLWVGAKTPDGELRVSTGAQDANGLSEGDDIREFIHDIAFIDVDSSGATVELDLVHWSNRQNDDNFDRRALANQHYEMAFNDYYSNEAGNHTPLGIKVNMRALAWGDVHAADFVILDYRIINISGNELQDVYVGLWVDTTVGSTDLRNPYDPSATVRWNFLDDFNGAFGGRGFVNDLYTVADDPNIWMAYERDDDGDEGLATSWIGYRLLGVDRETEQEPGLPPVSYNAWAFRGVPEFDSWYKESDLPDAPLLPGKYQIMSNGAFTVGETQEEDYSRAYNWLSLLSTGPFRTFAPGDTLQVTYAIVAGLDSLDLLDNSKVAQLAYDDDFNIPAGPPSPKLDRAFRDNSVTLAWEPGQREDENGDILEPDSPLRQPEHHISVLTGSADFQGYRIWRYQAEDFSGAGLKKEASQLVSEFDIIDGIGFDTGLPPLNEDGLREITDGNLLAGFPYQYSVTSFSHPVPDKDPPYFESGWDENGFKVYPGPAPASAANPQKVGVFPNPYRAGSLFDQRLGTIEKGRKIWFTGLPTRCTIKIFTLVGELVQTIQHDNPIQGQESWDLLSSYNRVIASGLYIYVVEDLETGEIQRGKLVIIK